MIKNIASRLIGNDRNVERRNVIWNIVGSFLFAFSSVFLIAAVNHILDDVQGGIFTFALSTVGQQMLNISYLGVRPHHITDTEQRYTFGEYLTTRIIGCLFAALCGILYLLINGYSFVKMMVIFLMVIYKVLDGFADVYECEFQRGGKLYLTGKSNGFRSLLSIIIFLITLQVTRNLITACIAINIAALLGVVFFNIFVLKELSWIQFEINREYCKKILISSASLFLAGFMELYIFNASRYAVDNQIGTVASKYFGAIFLPTSIINLVATFIIRPYLTELSVNWQKGRLKSFIKRILQVSLVIAVLGGVAVIAAYYFGIPVLGAINNADLTPYGIGLFYIIVAGTFNAVTTMLYYSLVIMEKQKSIFIAYGLGFILAITGCPALVAAYGLNGAGFAHMILMAVLTMTFGILTGYYYKKKAPSGCT